jgi:4-amino-4-deoxy-L-arabinose transferase-like glycosyltransferase
MTAAELSRLVRNPVERLYDALIDPARSERTLLVLLAGYLATWSLYAAIAKSGQDIHPDMGEMVVWSRETGLGTPKHPPLSAWLVKAWFSVFPLEPWAYYLFAMILPTVALWITWRIASRYLTDDKRVVAVAMLTFIPFYNFLALKFNANTVLTPLWAAATWWFLRSFETRRPGWAVLAGIGAAAAMLGKYWSVMLLAGLGLAALSDPRRRAYLRSPAPWLTIAVGAVLLVPHLVWIADHNFVSFTYAFEIHSVTLWHSVLSSLRFLAGAVGYVAVPVALCVFGAQPDAAAIRDTLLPPPGSERRMLMIAFAAPFALATVIAEPLRIELDTLWSISAMTLFPIVLLSSPLVRIPRQAAVGALTLALGFPLVMLVGSPLFASIILLRGVPNDVTQYRLIDQAVQRDWQERTDKPLRVIASKSSVANGLAFYLTSQPSTLDIDNPAETPWVDADRIGREGMAVVCPMPELRCMGNLDLLLARYPTATTKEVEIVRQHWIGHEPSVRYRIAIIPPL